MAIKPCGKCRRDTGLEHEGKPLCFECFSKGYRAKLDNRVFDPEDVRKAVKRFDDWYDGHLAAGTLKHEVGMLNNLTAGIPFQRIKDQDAEIKRLQDALTEARGGITCALDMGVSMVGVSAGAYLQGAVTVIDDALNAVGDFYNAPLGQAHQHQPKDNPTHEHPD